MPALALITSWGCGAALAIFFLDGLWWISPRGMAPPRPAIRFAINLLLRISLLLSAIYLIARGEWMAVMACLAGFAMVRPRVLRITACFTRRP